MRRSQLLIAVLAFLASDIALTVLLSAMSIHGQTFIMVGWSFIALQIVATLILYWRKKVTAAAVGATAVGLLVVLQLVSRIFVIRQ